MEPTTDLEATIAGAARGDRGAAEELYHRFGGRVFGLTLHLLRSREAAEDAAGEVFLRLGRSLRDFDGRIPFDRWLLRITSHLCIDWLRRRKREQALFATGESAGEEAAGAAASPLDEVVAREQQDVMRTALNSLPDRYRAPLVLRYYGDFTYDEIAERLEIQRTQVGVVLFRAKRALRQALSRPQEARER